jgi:hypothetical protein
MTGASGTTAGAVYVPTVSTEPFADPPSTDHVTPPSAPVTVAVKLSVSFLATVACDGLTVTRGGSGEPL